MYSGKRVVLRRVDPVHDTDDRYRWMNDPETVRYLGMRPARLSREETRKYLESCAVSTDPAEFAIVAEGRHIGGCCLRGFNHVARSAELGICIGEGEYRGKGYGTEVTALLAEIGFEQFNLNRIWLTVNADNLAGIRAYTKAGFQTEGVMRSHGFANGRYYDAHLMAVLRSDYDERKGLAQG